MNIEQRANIQLMEERVAFARARGPSDIFTSTAKLLTTALTGILGIVLIPVELVTTALGGCLLALTFGLLAVLLTVIWLPLFGLLVLTSWLWIRVAVLRPLLLLPGVVVAVISYVFVALMPDPERDAKHGKLALASGWPLTILIMRTDDEWLLALAGYEVE
jgi:hypothetical protein